MKNSIDTTKISINGLVDKADYLSFTEKKEWMEIINTANQSELNEIRDFFVNAREAQNNRKLKIIYEANLGDEYKRKIKSLSDNFIKQSIKKQEAHAGKTNENPENILKELDEI
ncbi:hypothetical protein KKD70_04680 [Patescibacteria group bacterium]|nr:hypothetical protein [Patescibacteria group bacterium]